MINWIHSWKPGCWCFDRRPLFSEHRKSYTGENGAISQRFNFKHAWVWVLWAPRSEAKPHVMPQAWGFTNGDDWGPIREEVGRSPILQLSSGDCDWVYLCDVIETCGDITPKIAQSLEALRADEQRQNLSRINRAFTSDDAEDFAMFLESVLVNDVPASGSEVRAYYFFDGLLIRKLVNSKHMDIFDDHRGCFVSWKAPETVKQQLTPISTAEAIAFIRKSNQQRTCRP